MSTVRNGARRPSGTDGEARTERPEASAVPARNDGSSSAQVEIKDVELRFQLEHSPDVVALDRMSLQIARGEFVAVIGPSGCGKSTLLNLIAGLYRPDGGTVAVDGAAVESISSNVGYVTQHDTLLPWMSLVDNVALPLKLRRRGDRRERTAHATDWLKRVQLGDFASAYPWQVSGGMRSRAMIARTLSYRPDVLLMDEPFGKLDALMRLRMQDLLLELWDMQRSTVLYITHDIEEALRLADRVVVMSRRPGKVLAEFPIAAQRPRTTRSDPELAALYDEIWAILQAEIEASEAEDGKSSSRRPGSGGR